MGRAVMLRLHMDMSTGRPLALSVQMMGRSAWPPPHGTEHCPKSPTLTWYRAAGPTCNAPNYALSTILL